MRFIIFLFLFTYCVYSNAKNVDSLKRELARNGFDREICIRIAQDYEHSNTDSALHYNRILLSHIASTDYDFHARSFNSVGNCYFLNGQLDTAIDLYRKAIASAEKSGRKIHDGIYWSSLGQALMTKGNLREAADVTEKAIQKLKSNTGAFQYEKQLANTYGMLGDIYLTAGIYDLANKTYYESLDLARKINDSVILLSTLNSLGSSYNNMGDNAMAIEKYNEALRISQAVGHHLATGTILLNLGEISLRQNENVKALEYLKQAEQSIKESGTDFNLASIYMNYGEYYKRAKDNTLAYNYYEKAMHLHSQSNAALSMAQVDIQVADLLSKENKNEEALLKFQKSLKVVQGENALKDIKECIQKMKEHFIRIKNVDSIALYSKLFDEANSNFLNDEKQKAIIANEIKYQTSLKDETISKQLSEISIMTKKNWIYLGVGILALGIALILFFMYRKINEQKRNIELQKREILHNTKNNLALLMSIFGAQSDDEHTFANAHENKDRILALNILNNLLYEKDGVSKANLNEYLSRFCEAKSHSVNVPISCDVQNANLELKGNILRDIGLLLNELISNSAKYAFENQDSPAIHISCTMLQSGMLQLNYSDNGKGLPEDFDLNEERKSFGMEFIVDLVAQHKGNISHANENGAKLEIVLRVK